ncbi:hypothetical protein LTR37_013517 [Vermiconidia calcicola]|uniref:Uncharacterized protein n=1 Tax=Vermiconidia calcicola TaxID=1690605 RepID=A0ACC3MWG0_9PEZI|nr:hypothetical protein LTR37_013517 [Vermiconidia calcicola]
MASKKGRPSHLLNRWRKARYRNISISTARNAAESPLLRLPPEIRNRIFRYVFGGRTIHINHPVSNCLLDAVEATYNKFTNGCLRTRKFIDTSRVTYSVCCLNEPDHEEADIIRSNALEKLRYDYEKHHVDHSCGNWKRSLLEAEVRSHRHCFPSHLPPDTP